MSNMLTANGLVISERTVGEQDKFIKVLTAEYGTMDISVKGANKINGKNHAAAQLLAYSKLCVNVRGERMYLNSSELIRDFYNIRLDIKKLALACYMGEVSGYSVPFDTKRGENAVLRLVLNCMHMLDEDKRSCEHIKSIFELRFLTEIGMMPQLVGCKECYSYDAEEMYFLIDEGYLLCGNDFEKAGLTEDSGSVKITPSQLAALQHIALADYDRLFNFKLSEESFRRVNGITERYLLSHLGRSFRTLEYYHSLL